MSTTTLKKRFTTPAFNRSDKIENLNFEFSKKYIEPKYYVSTNDKSVDTNAKLLKVNEIDENASKLLINIVNSLVLDRGAKLLVTPRGLLNGLRNKKDGMVFFGASNDGDTPKNDYVTNEYFDKVRSPNQESNTEPHYRVMFDPSVMKYFIRDLGFGCGCFLKVTDEIVHTATTLINIGNSFLVISFDPTGSENINIKVFSHLVKLNSNDFNMNKSVITIGRDSECDIMIDDPMLSRFHTTLFLYNSGEERKFGVKDGSSSVNEDLDCKVWKFSTNGTWLYLADDYEIFDGMIYKAHNTIFRVSVNDFYFSLVQTILKS